MLNDFMKCFGLIVALGLLAAPARADDDDVEAQLEKARTELKGARHELEQSRQALASLRERLAAFENYAGLGPFRPRFIVAVDGAMKLTFGGASYVEAAGAAPRKVKVSAEIKGRPGVVIAYWATWCKPCTSEEELSRMRVLSDALAREGYAFVSFAIDGLEAVRNDPRAGRWHYPLYQANDGHLDMLPEAFVKQKGVGLPMFFVARADGTVTYYRQGPLDEAVVAELLAAARQKAP
jgi:thiol-disulfide isomerase/thioredoxin